MPELACLICLLIGFIQISDVKSIIEAKQGKDVYPAAQQMLIHKGKVLNNASTIEENQVTENSSVVIMLSKVHHILVVCAKQYSP